MPLYYFKCSGPSHEFKVKRILTPEEADQPQKCVCGALLQRDAQGPNTTVHEVLDNGLMPRSLERFSDAQRLYKERSKAHK